MTTHELGSDNASHICLTFEMKVVKSVNDSIPFIDIHTYIRSFVKVIYVMDDIQTNKPSHRISGSWTLLITTYSMMVYLRNSEILVFGRPLVKAIMQYYRKKIPSHHFKAVQCDQIRTRYFTIHLISAKIHILQIYLYNIKYFVLENKIFGLKKV